jgi:hypothetical protein
MDSSLRWNDIQFMIIPEIYTLPFHYSERVYAMKSGHIHLPSPVSSPVVGED